MKIAIGADHRGFRTKSLLTAYLTRSGHDVLDFGVDSEAPADYPDIAWRVGESVARGKARYGILFCYTGQGMVMAANKVKGVRAALCAETKCARLSRAHNNANVLVMPAGFLPYGPRMRRVVKLFLSTRFAAGRHQRRVNKIAAYERKRSLRTKP